MPKIFLSGVEIDFPFEPYGVQVSYMRAVIDAIKKHGDAVLESPTGTGKTLCLLCATLSWLRYAEKLLIEAANQQPGSLFRPKLPKIIYSSRTHSQLSQVMSELKRTVHRNVKITILGSRDYLCVHPEVSKAESLTMKNILCKIHMKAKTCMYGARVENYRSDPTAFNEITDIEDLVTKCKKLTCCPFYTAKELQEKAEVIFLPYNYLLDPQIRKSLNLNLQGSIVILDEGHNIEKICEETASVTLVSSVIASAVCELTKEMEEWYREQSEGLQNQAEREYTTDELSSVKEKLYNLEKSIYDIELERKIKEGSTKQGDVYESITLGGTYIFNLLSSVDITLDNYLELITILTTIADKLSNGEEKPLFGKTGVPLKKVADALSIIFASVAQEMSFTNADKYFKVYIEPENPKKISKSGETLPICHKEKKVHFWCFNPAFGMRSLKRTGVRSVILTSGTLSPVPATVRELALKDPITLENPHIIRPTQVLVNVLSKGPRNVELKSTYSNRGNTHYWVELGLTIQNFSRIIPDGLLVFFPSYFALNKAQEIWQEKGLWSKINTIKPIYCEPKHQAALAPILEEYYETVRTGQGKGAILMGVCRGKIAEGLDFSNSFGRGVLITGLPYPPLFDPKVSLKKQYVDENRDQLRDMTGDIWYHCEATRAVNQAIGRVIRHSSDYGAIILCDSRFGTLGVCSYLSKWLQRHLTKMKSFGQAISGTRHFFREITGDTSTPAEENNVVIDITGDDEPGQILEEELEVPLVPLPIPIPPPPCICNGTRGRPTNELGPGTSGINALPGPSRPTPQTGVIDLIDLCDDDEDDGGGDDGNDESSTPLHTKEKRELEVKIPEIISQDSHLEVQPAKRRKIKLRPIKFEDQPSNVSEDNSNSVSEIKDFVSKVKSILDADSYAQFTAVIKKYQSTGDFDEILCSLISLFIEGPKDPFITIFQECSRFFIGDHLEKFKQYCKDQAMEIDKEN